MTTTPKPETRQYIRHGLADTKFHRAWAQMKERINNKNSQSYSRYGGRGITMGERWKYFMNFKHDMYVSYLEHSRRHGGRDTQIERIDTEKWYSLDNCRWATLKEQANNRRSNRYVVFDGQRYTMSQLAEKYKIHWDTLYKRLVEYKWPILKALTHPLRFRKDYHASLRVGGKLTMSKANTIRRIYRNKKATIRELAEKYGVHKSRISAVIRGASWSNKAWLSGGEERG